MDSTCPSSTSEENLPLPYTSLRFTPVGLFDLRRRLSSEIPSVGIFTAFQRSFDASDVAWFTPGLASASCASIGHNDVYPEFLELLRAIPGTFADGTVARNALRQRVRDLTFDSAALLDRAFGGTTLVIHVDGTTRPGSLMRPEYVKADVYFPGHWLHEREKKKYSLAVAEIVQRFVVDIGLPTIERFERCAANLWPLKKKSGTQDPYPIQPLQPAPHSPHSSTFTYYGRPSVKPAENELVHPQSKDTLSAAQDREKARLAHISDPSTISRHDRSSLRLVQHTPELFVPSNRGSPDRSSLRSVQHVPERSVLPKRSSTTSVHSSPHPNVAAASGSLSTAFQSPSRSSPRRLLHGTDLANFIRLHGLENAVPLIDVTRRNVPPFSWKDELLALDLEEEVLQELMAAMAAYTAEGSVAF